MIGRIVARARWGGRDDLGYWLKAVVVALPIGVAAGHLYWLGSVPACVAEAIVNLQAVLASLIGADPTSEDSIPILPQTIAFGLLSGLASFGLFRPSAPFLWPGRPDILRSVELRPDKGADHPEYPDRPLIGRDEDMRGLMTFAGRAAGDMPRWSWIGGPMGIGKSKLGVEWLLKLGKLGWDSGFLKETATVEDIARARFRREAAIVFDDALKRPDLREIVDAFLQHDGRLRILLSAQVEPELVPTRDAAFDMRLAERLWPGRRLARLSMSELKEIAPERSQAERAQADGRPLMVLLGADPGRVLRQRRRDLMAVAASDDARAYLVFAALAAPLKLADLRVHLPGIPRLELRETIHQGRNRADLRREVPPLRPDPLADGVLAACAEDAGATGLFELFARAIDANPAAVESRLGSMGQSLPLGVVSRDLLKRLWSEFDSRVPGHRAAVLLRATTLFDTTVDAPKTPEAWRLYSAALEDLNDLALRRTTDPALQLHLAVGAVNAIGHSGAVGRFDDLERWRGALRDAAARTRWSSKVQTIASEYNVGFAQF
ncbi:hypothetical protein JMM63_20905 [Rhodovulum sulfidophilum]|uniref:hypothetical protein n=1 Tax=Rhodovulum sulfidophilum TaxID=35806 RepID=UPI00192313AA|nr:hypothetical protein [Rhodovulum sulfidophilum]MBL3597977.1 hypothetical protein [Rhodovulum sulfidophilum]